MSNIAYIRVSTYEQNQARQMEAMKQHNIDKYFIEKISAKDTKRPKFLEMMDYIREDDVVYIHDFSRIARNTKDLLNIVDELKQRNITLKSNKENLDTSTPTGKLMLTMIGAINTFEREVLLDRIKEGIHIAKQEGKYKGREKIVIENFDNYYNDYKNRKITKPKLAEMLGITRPTLNRIIKDYEEIQA